VNFIRFASKRDIELQKLNSSKEEYNRFLKIPRDKNDFGALRENTRIELGWIQDDVHYKIIVATNDKEEPKYKILESFNGSNYIESKSQTISPERFPLRIFSQGQIAEMAEEGQALFDIIDENGEVGGLKQVLDETCKSYFSKMARLREIKKKLDKRSEIERKLEQIETKLNALDNSHSSDVYRSFELAQRQKGEVKESIKQVHDFANRITSLSGELVLNDWSESLFDQTTDADILLWRSQVDNIGRHASEVMMQMGQDMREQIAKLENSQQYLSWSKRLKRIEQTFEKVKTKLDEEGISDPKEIDDFLASKRQIELELREQDKLEKEKVELKKDIELKKGEVLQARQAITEKRKAFINKTIRQNQFVRIKVVPFGNNELHIERDLRQLIDASDDRFSDDVTEMTAKICNANNDDRLKCIEDVKQKLLNKQVKNGHFKNYLDKKEPNSPEFFDHVTCWYPEDDLDIEYSREGDGRNWSAILQGSKGQRSAALLAFLLSFGQEPIVLDQPEDDLDNHLIYDLIVTQIRENKLRRQLIIVTHNPNIVVNGDAEMIFAMDFVNGQCSVTKKGSLQKKDVRFEVCRVMEGGLDALSRRWARLGKGMLDA